jgi:hypothetical protein
VKRKGQRSPHDLKVCAEPPREARQANAAADDVCSLQDLSP